MSAMEWVIRPRQAGKTHDLIEWAAQEEPGGPLRYIVVSSIHDATALFHSSDAKDANGNQRIRFPLSAMEAIHYHGRAAEFAVDNADVILQSLMQWRIAVASATVEEQ